MAMNGGSKSTGCIVGLHQTSTRGHVSRRGFGRRLLCYVKAVALICLRGCGRGGKRRRGGRSLVAAALSKIGAGVALLVREVGVALLLCFFSGRRDMCVCCLCFVGAFTLSKSDASPQCIINAGVYFNFYNNVRSVSTMTTADSAVRIS